MTVEVRLGSNFPWNRTLADDARDNPAMGDATSHPHPHFHTHGGSRHSHSHVHPDWPANHQFQHAHSSRRDLPAHEVTRA